MSCAYHPRASLQNISFDTAYSYISVFFYIFFRYSYSLDTCKTYNKLYKSIPITDHVLRSAKSAKVAILSKIYPSDNPPIPENKENKGKTNSANNRNGITYKGKPASLSSLGQISLPYTHTSMSTAQKQDLLPGSDPNVNDFAQKVYTARVVGVDPGKDIAVLKIDAPVIDLFPIDVGTSRDLRVGQSAFAIGKEPVNL